MLDFYIMLGFYQVLDVVPFVALAAASFEQRFYSIKKLIGFTLLLYSLGMLRRSVSAAFPNLSAMLSILWIVLYFFVYLYVVKEKAPKMLFALITILNYASMVYIAAYYIAFHYFHLRSWENPYSWKVSGAIVLALLPSYPLIYSYLKHSVAPLMSNEENDSVWKTLWLVPATFCVFFYYNLYTAKDTLAYASSLHNLVFTFVISGGFFFVLSLIMKMVKMSAFNTRLLQERHQLELRTLQYQHLAKRMEEARRARHDLRQCLAVLSVYLESGETEDLRRSVEEVCASFSAVPPISYCLYMPLNAVIGYYAEAAARQNIDFQIQVDYPENTAMTETDFVILFGNLLENAIEACSRQKMGERRARLEVKALKKNMIILLDNTFEGILQKENNAFYSSKHEGIGIGTASIRQIAESYGGRADFKAEGNWFMASVYIPLP